MEEKLKNYIKQNHELLEKLLKELCAIPAPSHHEGKRAQFCKDWLIAQGAQNVTIDEAQNVIYALEDTGTNELVVFMAHTDTVFPDREPMPLKVKDHKMYCPGVGDDTANLAILLMIAKFITDNNLKPQIGILFVANSCEEGLGNLKGCKQLMATYNARIREVISFDGTFKMFCNEPVGSARYKISVQTRGGHSYSDFGTPNAIAILAELIHQIYQIKLPKENEQSQTTYNVGLIEGGTSVNTIAQSAQMLFEYRSNSRSCLEKMNELFMAIIETFKNPAYELQVELLGLRPCAGEINLSQQKLLESKCLAAATRYLSTTPHLEPASTDCNIPFSLGIPAFCMGLYDGDGMHTREEWVDLNSLPTGFLIGSHLVLSYF